MSQKHKPDKIVYYTSDLLDKAGIQHAIFTRLGGVSTGPFYSLNFKRGIGDIDQNVDQNRRFACDSINVKAASLVYAKLIHSDGIYIASKHDAGKDINSIDCLLTVEKNLPLALSVADCLPILIAHPLKKVIAIVHGGWRGLTAEIIPKAIKKITKLTNCLESELLVVIGPGISVESYPVGDEVVRRVNSLFEDTSSIIVPFETKKHLNLRKLAELQLQNAGVFNIEHIDIDTAQHTDEFYSYRAESGSTGRFGAIISL